MTHVPSRSTPARPRVSTTDEPAPAASVAELLTRLTEASDALVQLVAGIDPAVWSRSPRPSAWSPGKEAEHVADAIELHLWRIRSILGEPVGSRPTIERATLTTERTPADVAERIRMARDGAVQLVSGLTDVDLARRSTRGGRSETVRDVIRAPLIRHLETHLRDLRATIRRLERPSSLEA